MSLEKRAGSPFWYYRFKVNGRRFFRSTETGNRRRAEEIEREARRQAQADAKLEAEAEKAHFGDGPMTLDVAALRYWNEVGQHHKAAAATKQSLKWLVEQLGKDTLIRDIRDQDVARMVAKRRADRVNNVARGKSTKKGLTPAKMISPASVNRYATEPLRKVLLRARKAWGQEIREINWKEHLLKEPRERVRALTDDEEARLFAALPAQFHVLVDFCLRIGAREAEAIDLTWPMIDWTDGTIRLRGKGDKERTIPMPDDVRAILWPTRQVKGRVFRYANGDPISKWGFASAFRRARDAAGVKDFRIHDLRHTAATRLLQTPNGNLKQVQRLLGHEDIATTARYAHVFDEDLRAAMNRAHAEREGRRKARADAEAP